MKLFFSRLDKSDSSSPPESPEINTEDILKKPTQGETRKEMEREEFVRRDEENHKKQDSEIREWIGNQSAI